MKAVILDDDPAIGRLVSRVASPLGFTFDAVTTSQDFRLLYEAGVPEVIFLDLQLGNTDGVEELRYLSNHGYRNPLVLVSGFDERVLSTTEQLANALGLVPVATLGKPIRLERLMEVLKDVKARLERPSAIDVLKAIGRHEMALQYQPIVTCDRKALRGVEALIRWNRPGTGQLPPDQFVPLAEESVEIIDSLTEWVISKAAQEQERQRGKGSPVRMSVNVSGKSLHSLDFPDRVNDILQNFCVPYGQFCLEITESVSSENAPQTMDIVTRLRLKGIEVSIDDFGTGYSSLKQLRQLPFSELKIDRSFVGEITKSKDALAIVTATVGLARAMELSTIAEGVENDQVAALLEGLGVDALQGYLVSPPLSSSDLDDWLCRFSRTMRRPPA